MSRTQTKGIRLTEGELARARAVTPLHPAAASEAELLRIIFLRGMLLEEAGLAATRVLSPVLTALQFLARVGVVELGAPGVVAEPDLPDEGLDEAATEDVSGLGGAFL